MIRRSLYEKVMVCGCGAQGSTICRKLDEEPNIEEIICADYSLAAAEAVCKLMKKGTPKTSGRIKY